MGRSSSCAGRSSVRCCSAAATAPSTCSRATAGAKPLLWGLRRSLAPFYARGKPRAADGVDASLLGTVERRDGRRQVTYRDQPLYFYVHDPKRQVLCNDVAEFGGTWFALDATGEPPA